MDDKWGFQTYTKNLLGTIMNEIQKRDNRIASLETEVEALRDWIDRVEDQLDGRED